MHQDIGEHKHEMVIYDSYETYAVCKKCGMHDWSTSKGYKGDCSLVPYFLKKYPDCTELYDVDGNLQALTDTSNLVKDENGVDELSECQHCHCSTKTTETGQCGKCEGFKAKVIQDTRPTPNHTINHE